MAGQVGVWPGRWECGRAGGGVAGQVGVWLDRWGCGRAGGGVAVLRRL